MGPTLFLRNSSLKLIGTGKYIISLKISYTITQLVSRWGTMIHLSSPKTDIRGRGKLPKDGIFSSVERLHWVMVRTKGNKSVLYHQGWLVCHQYRDCGIIALLWWVPYTLFKMDKLVSGVKDRNKKNTQNLAIRVTRSSKEAYDIDTTNTNTLWRD